MLRNSGRYICISLLQEHILRTLVASFSSTFAFRVIHCHDAEIKAKENDESPMPVFMAVATKFIKLPQPVRTHFIFFNSIIHIADFIKLISFRFSRFWK